MQPPRPHFHFACLIAASGLWAAPALAGAPFRFRDAAEEVGLHDSL
ncbi:MAG: hypothetical protein KY476_21685 [Planctomycetes bacterium]|nr:hypothetical protein [Planctomycetota bacterium]